jgi:uncharacterized membrane protein YphA (DoxX/SURF4 family)
MNKISLTSILLRIGLAVVFLYAAIASFVEPAVWIGYLPTFVANSSSAGLLLKVVSVIEILVSLWLLSGKKTFYAAIVSALMLAGIIVTNLASIDIIFRDFGLFFAALALAALSY